MVYLRARECLPGLRLCPVVLFLLLYGDGFESRGTNLPGDVTQGKL